ncbi:Trichodiene oxygenase [Cyphellophora attinorum]|uniref:Trichodiene oxygenase n=1 Tax=Cyphellophora attinorum TaxID=1664694 RepID=A0A0N1H389_9EURO|nr:Trichodiene oxygenase [Phialophora attinorum]KPI35953.1 Trichodiene oxygenase [Phialophora attinorum]
MTSTVAFTADSEVSAASRWRQYLVLALATYLVFKVLIHPFILSPVRHIPGPWYCRISRLPLQYATYQRRRTAFVTGLLDTYGPIVVIAPDQVHTTDDTAMKTIYDKTSIKTSFYASMGSWKGVTSTLGFLTYPEAAPSRNNLVQCFQNRNLAALIDNIESHVDDFIRILDQRAQANEAVDGVKNRLLANVNEEAARDFIRRFHAFSTWNAMKSFIPGADLLVRLVGSQRWKRLRADCNDLDITAREALERWQTADADADRHDKDVLSMLQSMNTSKASAVPPEDVSAYMVEMLAAGSSTTSHTAAFASFLLTRHPDAQRRLREELAAAFPLQDEMDIRKTVDLPFLDGVLRETMRMYPMIPGPLERYTGSDMTMSGYNVCKGVIASNAAFNQGRLPHVFPEPDSWKPERWIEATEEMKLNWIPFGHGSRACPGSNLAMTELKYMIGKIFRKFQAVIPPGHEDDVLEMADVFAAGSNWEAPTQPSGFQLTGADTKSAAAWAKDDQLPGLIL